MHRYDISRPRSRHKRKFGKYKKCLSMMMLTRSKKHLRSICNLNTEAKFFFLNNTEEEKRCLYLVYIYKLNKRRKYIKIKINALSKTN